MPRFFFNVRDGQTIPDDTGVELVGLREAQVLALHRAASLLKNDEIIWLGHEWSMDVTDEDGTIGFKLTFQQPILTNSP